MSPVISRTARCWSAVSSHGRLCLRRVVRSRFTSKATPTRWRLATVRARMSMSCRSSSSSNARRRLPCSASVEGGRPVNGAERLRQRRKPRRLPERLRKRVGGEGDERVEVPLDQRANDAMAEPLGGGIDRQHLAGRERIGLALRVRQHDVFPGGELPSVIEPHRPRDQQRLPDGDGPVEERLPGPHALQQAAVVAEHRVEDSEPPPGRQHAFGDHSSDARDLLADFRPGERSDRRRVDVAMGEMPEEIARRADAEPLQLVSPPLADPLEKLDRHVEPHGARIAATRLGRASVWASAVGA